jgi:probable F420-dependent oxidoreductase
MELGKLGIWYFLDRLSPPDAAKAAQRMEELGYSALWLPETTGRHPFVHASWLLANTKKLILATGIANIYNREPGVTVAAQRTLAEQSGNRFLLGLGVSHKPLVEGVRGLDYGPPVKTMRTYLERMQQAPDRQGFGFGGEVDMSTVIAALGPKMLETARDKCQGAHPYFTSPDHTKMARDILGSKPMLCVEQKVVLETDPKKARDLARAVAQIYIGLPNYRNNWLRMGLAEADLENGGSDKFVDTTFAWGTADQIRDRIKQHFDAGASHVCIQPVNPNGEFGDIHWKVLEELAPGN